MTKINKKNTQTNTMLILIQRINTNGTTHRNEMEKARFAISAMYR